MADIATRSCSSAKPPPKLFVVMKGDGLLEGRAGGGAGARRGGTGTGDGRAGEEGGARRTRWHSQKEAMRVCALGIITLPPATRTWE
jgi:hypothetical protein